jgi:hypothetical protein
MYNWPAFKELFTCIGIVMLLGMTFGLVVINEQYGAHEKAYAIIYESLTGFHETGQLQEDAAFGKKLAIVGSGN